MKTYSNISSAEELVEVIEEVGFLPLLQSPIRGFCAEAMVDSDCRYQVFDDGGWDWPMWKWKGPIVQIGCCTYGKFFCGKAGYLSMQWWQDFMNYRRSQAPDIVPNSIEDIILDTLQEGGSMITRDLRRECGFNGQNMRSKFDGYVTRLQMQCRIVTENFVYPHDKHGNEYGWGWSLLATPENLFGHDMCRLPEDNGKQRQPEESLDRMKNHLAHCLPDATEKQIMRLLGERI